MHEYPSLRTGILGGVDPPSEDELNRMQAGSYVLHARDGKISRAPAERVRLPDDPNGHPQGANVAMAADGTVYVAMSDKICKSADGGRSWQVIEHREQRLSHFNTHCGAVPTVLENGTLLAVSEEGEPADPLRVFRSENEGRSWDETSRIEIDFNQNTRSIYKLFHLGGNAVFCLVQCSDVTYADGKNSVYAAGKARLLAYRSEDGGGTWQEPVQICLWSGEPGLGRMASGNILAVVRHQRARLPQDPEGLEEITGANRIDPTRPYKHVFLADSDDNGHTWNRFRQLTTEFGQCYGYPAGLSDGRVAVLHDTRYGPGPQSGRAMISLDEGANWENETYYVWCGAAASGYSQSVVFDDDTILTVAGSSDRRDADKKNWNSWSGHSYVTAIRWRLED